MCVLVQTPACVVLVQAFYAEFGELMMRQPVIGLDFQSYLPIAIVPYMLLLAFNAFNRYARHVRKACALSYICHHAMSFMFSMACGLHWLCVAGSCSR